MRLPVRIGAASLVIAAWVLATCGPARPLQAADEAAPQAFVLLAAPDDLLGTGEYVLKLTSPTEQKQWTVLKSYLDEFLIGVDKKLPVRVAIVFDPQGDRYVWSVPISNATKFRKDNIATILTPRSKQLGGGMYELGSHRPGDFHGFLLIAPPYAHIGETKNDVTALGVNPGPQLQPLLAQHFELAVDLRNTKLDPAAQAKRRELFQGARKKTMSMLKKEKGETDGDFELRKKATETESAELEWFFSEAEHALMGLSVDRSQGLGKMGLELKPIPNSPLAAAVAQLQTKPSHFANVEKSADPILSARLNHPLSDVRKKTASAMLSLGRDWLKGRVDADNKRSAEEREAAKQLVDKASELLQASIQQGLADGFAEVHKGSGGKNLLLAGVRTADGTKAVELLSLLPKARAGATVKQNIADESGVRIHSIVFTKEKNRFLADLVGGDTVYVGTSKDSVWAAAGDGALDALKAAIKKSSQPAPAGAEKAPWAELVVHAKPWLDLTNADVPPKRADAEYRKLAGNAFGSSDDKLSVQMRKEQDRIVGEITVQTGYLRFAGEIASKFSKDNLDESSQKGGKKNALK